MSSSSERVLLQCARAIAQHNDLYVAIRAAWNVSLQTRIVLCEVVSF
jgi:hypothetical protein